MARNCAWISRARRVRGALIAKTPGQDPGTALHLPVGFLAAPGQIQRLRMTDMEDLRLPRVRTKVGWAAAAANAR